MKIDAYKSLPKRVIEEKGFSYPIFSEVDEYIKNYEQISSDHIAVYERDGVNPFMEEVMWSESEEIAIELVTKYTSTKGRVLDVGCGMGRLLAKLPEYERYGMDISSAYLQYAARSGAEVCLSKVEEMPYNDGFFDTVVCTDVLEHVVDPHVAITQLFRVLKVGGHLVIRVPFREDLELYLRPDYPYHMAHLRNFDEFSLRLLFEKVFSGEVVEQMLGPYVEHLGYLKYPLRFRGARILMKSILQLCSLAFPKYKKTLVSKIFKPVEISIVVRK
jgi:ubiquinone/menaquinone biosynthesis C-methylase UbiE